MIDPNSSSPSALLLLDTPKRLSLTTQSNAIRVDLKAWEKSFAAAHQGRKADREDIKRHPEIAKKYKEYNRIRDVLSGKATAISAASSSSPSASTKLNPQGKVSKHERDQRKSKSTRTSTSTTLPRKRPTDSQSLHPSTIDPYDAPPTANRHTPPKPYAFRQVIGPTPQRDGKALGLFDLLSTSGSSQAQATPSSRKRKADALKELHYNVVQTPSRGAAGKRKGGDLLEHLGTEEGENDVTGTGRRHSRTPASEGKKFLLSQFFATPTVGIGRFANIGEKSTARKVDHRLDDLRAEKTPLRNSILKDRMSVFTPQHEKPLPASQPPPAAATDATPPFLKRLSSFNQRLLSASASASNTVTTESTSQPAIQISSTTTAPAPAVTAPLPFSNPSTIRRTHAPRSLRPSNGRSLSEIVQSLRKLDDEKYGDSDELDAMRELESTREADIAADVLAGDSQTGFMTQEPNGSGKVADVAGKVGNGIKGEGRVWKKKGAKRTTRRVNMRPSTIKPAEEPRWMDGGSGSDDDDKDEDQKGRESGSEEGESEDELARVEETQLHPAAFPLSPEISGDELAANDDDDDNYVDGADERERERPPKKKTKKEKEKEKGRGHSFVTVSATATVSGVGVARKKATKKTEKEKKPRTYNPNAASRQNFRSLKMKNRNSKARGSGSGRRFGAKGGRRGR